MAEIHRKGKVLSPKRISGGVLSLKFISGGVLSLKFVSGGVLSLKFISGGVLPLKFVSGGVISKFVSGVCCLPILLIGLIGCNTVFITVIDGHCCVRHE